jgi:hypothetical protein
MQSPVPGLFLTPHPPTPAQYRTLDGSEKDKGGRERLLATPTDFTVDYGKSPKGGDSANSKSPVFNAYF